MTREGGGRGAAKRGSEAGARQGRRHLRRLAPGGGAHRGRSVAQGSAIELPEVLRSTTRNKAYHAVVSVVILAGILHIMHCFGILVFGILHIMPCSFSGRKLN